jgi:hypothetical protein
MIRISFPEPQFRIKEAEGKEWIFDGFRKQWVRLTPEEWVRQNMLQYLVQVKQYPASLIAVEKEIMVGELKKRFDILVYRNDQPWMMIECKEMNVPIDESVLRQILTYNSRLKVNFLVITNGNTSYGFAIHNDEVSMIEEFPDF